MSKWPEWVQAELDAGRIREEELEGLEVFVGPSDVHLKAVRKFGMVIWLGETWWAWENQHDNRNFGDWTDEAPPLPRGESIRQYRNLIAALSGRPTAEVERLKRIESAAKRFVASPFGIDTSDARWIDLVQALSPDTPERGEGGAG